MKTQRIYLKVPFQEKDEAKQLGARWDPSQRAWYILSHVDTAPFAHWLESKPLNGELAFSASNNAENDKQANQPLSLKQYLQRIAQTIQHHYQTPQWLVATVSEWKQQNNGHIYIELIEQDAQTRLNAQARAIIWASEVETAVTPFMQATGQTPAQDMQLLLSVSARLHPQYGLSLSIHQIDPNFTLGLIEAQLKQIRSALQQAGIFQNNQRLNTPAEFTKVAVISSESAAGLGDFRQEADHLEHLGLCQFDYFYSLMQGQEAPTAIVKQLNIIQEQDTDYDAVIMIRGGGAQTDLATLNNLALAQTICLCPYPVFSGIGHERDHTILDEVAHLKFDTPSKVSHHILQTIMHNAQQALEHQQSITQLTSRLITSTKQQLQHLQQSIQEYTQHALHAQYLQLEQYRDTLINQAEYKLSLYNQSLQKHYQAITQNAQHALRNYHKDLNHQLDTVLSQSKNQTQQAIQNTRNLMEYILGLGPEKTLKRGFALVQDQVSKAYITSCKQVTKNFIIRFQDGSVKAKPTEDMHSHAERGNEL